MRSNLSESIPRMADATLDIRVLVFTLTLSFVTGVLSGAGPALDVSANNFNQALRGVMYASRRSVRLQNFLTVAEVAVSMILLVGAGLLITNLASVSRIDLGFNPSNVITFRISVPTQKYPRGPASADFFRQMLERLKSIPGVASAGALSHAPLSGQNLSRGYIREGDPIPARNDSLIASYAMMTPGLIATMSMRLREGRDFSDADSGSAQVAIINRTLAERLWPGASAIGHQIRVFTDENFPRTVVGVVDDIKQRSMIRTFPHIFVPHTQDPISTMTVMLRTERDVPTTIMAARAILATIDKDIPAYDILTLDEKIHLFSAPMRSATTMIGLFAATAFVLATTGIYGVVAYFVSRQISEIGIRMAVGAARADIVRMVLRRGFVLSSTGVTLGVVGSLALTRVLSGLLFGVSPTDPRVFAGVAVTLLAAALGATLIPALKACHVDPLAALRAQ
jgi:predicted permease